MISVKSSVGNIPGVVKTPLNEVIVFAVQARIKSYNRFQTHCECLGGTPQRVLLPTQRMLQEVPKVLDLIHQLASHKAIISSEVSYITTRNNLSSICSSGTILGADALKSRAVTYVANCISTGGDSVDRKNGDGNVICFGPNLIDQYSLEARDGFYGFDRIKCKQGLLHTKIDLSAVDLSRADPRKGIYNQFFKIKDFAAPAFSYRVSVAPWLSIRFFNESCNNGYFITFEVDDLKGEVAISNQELIFYGGLYQVNAFCLLSMFKFIEKVDNKSIVDAFYKNIKNSQSNEITKILKLYGQHLTVFSECNFNQCVTCTVPGFFKKIYDVELQICYPLENLKPKDHQERLTVIANGKFSKLPCEKKPLGLYTFNENGAITHILGKTFKVQQSPYSIDLDNVDWRLVPAQRFMGSEYTNFFMHGQTSNTLRVDAGTTYKDKQEARGEGPI
jgi:hypothetical protein